jgi:hypothetical protein
VFITKCWNVFFAWLLVTRLCTCDKDLWWLIYTGFNSLINSCFVHYFKSDLSLAADFCLGSLTMWWNKPSLAETSLFFWVAYYKSALTFSFTNWRVTVQKWTVLNMLFLQFWTRNYNSEQICSTKSHNFTMAIMQLFCNSTICLSRIVLQNNSKQFPNKVAILNNSQSCSLWDTLENLRLTFYTAPCWC